MGSLNINYIKKPERTKSGYLYSDIHLDLVNDYKVVGNFKKSETQLIDIKVSYDDAAIRNSLNSLLNTNPGERLLLPEYGINMKRYIFSPVSTGNAYAIGTVIKQGIERWEPRVSVKLITVVPVPDDHRYDIALDLFIPSLGKPVGYLGKLIENSGITI